MGFSCYIDWLKKEGKGFWRVEGVGQCRLDIPFGLNSSEFIWTSVYILRVPLLLRVYLFSSRPLQHTGEHIYPRR